MTLEEKKKLLYAYVHENTRLRSEVAELRARRDFLLESNNRLVEERRKAVSTHAAEPPENHLKPKKADQDAVNSALRRDLAALERRRIAGLRRVADKGLEWKAKFDTAQGRIAELERERDAAKAEAEARLKQLLTQTEIHAQNTTEWRVAMEAALVQVKEMRKLGEES